MYGTLGNPNFAAAWCCATLPSRTTLVRKARSRNAAVVGAGLIALQMAAIVATGSRATLLGVAAAAVVFVTFSRRGRIPAFSGVALAALALLAPGTRPLGETIAGRAYLTKVALSGGVPMLGHGPGSFEVAFAQRQAAWLPSHPEDRRFAALLDHAHNDYAELLIEYGAAGLAVLLLVAAAAIRAVRASPESVPNVAALAALGALALVDFPLHRPAEWSLFWLPTGAWHRSPQSC